MRSGIEVGLGGVAGSGGIEVESRRDRRGFLILDRWNQGGIEGGSCRIAGSLFLVYLHILTQASPFKHQFLGLETHSKLPLRPMSH